VESAGSLLALVDGLETSPQRGFADFLSPFKFTRPPLAVEGALNVAGHGGRICAGALELAQERASSAKPE
jgi:hypothetical protein